MSNLVLYRKHRPQNFFEVIGQEHVIQTLVSAISSGDFAHAYLLTGPRGTGKTTIARLLAKAINCEDTKSHEPCNKCSSCLEFSSGRALDLIEIDAASNRGVDEIRELKEGIRFTPAKSKYKVFIIDEVHMLTKEAFNALLKTLEEPPAHAVFVLATTEVHKVLPTILSRVQRFDLKKLSLKELLQRLQIIIKKEKVKTDSGVLELIAINADGSVRDAETMLEQVITYAADDKKITVEEVQQVLGIVDINLVMKFTDLLGDKDSVKALSFINKLLEEGHDLIQFTKSLIAYLRKILFVKIDKELASVVGEELTKEQLQVILKQAESFSLEEWQKIVQLFIEAGRDIKYSDLPQISLELATMEVMKAEK